MNSPEALAPILLPMARWRVLLVGAVACGLVSIHAFDVVTQTEQWPFSYYFMYARTQKRAQLQVLALFGVFKDGKKTMIRRITEDKFVPPLNERRLRNMLMAAWGKGQTTKNIRGTARLLRDYMKLYESRRLLGLHQGPEMIEARMYKLTWPLRYSVNNQKPQKQEFLLGVNMEGRIRRSLP
ncbi:MAG: hypothetical protein ACREJC_14535, partial [Tepidisphaeraceae bacterium]